MKTLSTHKGFTIIEVVLVLAIAGLIFLMVFVALPALQRSQRDTQRRNDMARMATALTNWQVNHSNDLPKDTEKTDFLNNYLKQSAGEFKDPSAGNYELDIITYSNDGSSAANPKINLYTGAKCDDEKATSSNGTNDYAIVYKLEGSGTFCQDNQ